MDNKGSNQSLVKMTNQNLILKEVRSSQQLSRSELAKRLHLSNPSVSKHVDDLLAKGLLVETGSLVTDIGRRPIMLQFNGSHGCVAVVDLSSSNARICVADLLGNKLEYARVEGERIITTEVLERILTTLKDMVNNLGDRCGALMGICIGAPGLIEPETGRIIRSPHFKKDPDYPDLTAIFSEEFDVPVIVRNDINLAVVGEHNFGAGQEHQSLLMLNINVTNAGLGAVIDGRSYEGSHGYACSIESILLPSTDLSAPLKSLADLLKLDQLVASVREIISEGRESVIREWLSDPADLTFDDVSRAWGMSDIAVSVMVRKYARGVALACRCLTALFDPELIIVGGQAFKLGVPFLNEINRLYDELPGVSADLCLAKLSDSAVIFGGIDFATRQAIDRIVMQ